MKLLKGTITKLNKEVEIKTAKLARLSEKNSAILKEMDTIDAEIKDLQKLIADGSNEETEESKI